MGRAQEMAKRQKKKNSVFFSEFSVQSSQIALPCILSRSSKSCAQWEKMRWVQLSGTRISQGRRFFFFFFFDLFAFHFCFLSQLHLQPMEVSQLGVTSDLQLRAYPTATAMPQLAAASDPYPTRRGPGSNPPPQGS